MHKTTLTLSEPIAKTLKVYTAQTKNSMRAQSEVVEEALEVFFKRRNVEIEGDQVSEPKEHTDGSTHDLHAEDLKTYLSKNSRFKFFVYDRREIRTIADNLGFKTNRVRAELRKLGYCQIKNTNGLLVWKRDAVCI